MSLSFGSVPLEELTGTNPTLHMQFKSQCLVNSVTWIYEEGLTEEEGEPRLYFKLRTRPARKQITAVLSALRCRKNAVTPCLKRCSHSANMCCQIAGFYHSRVSTVIVASDRIKKKKKSILLVCLN